jgi:hypothetical protein
MEQESLEGRVKDGKEKCGEEETVEESVERR